MPPLVEQFMRFAYTTRSHRIWLRPDVYRAVQRALEAWYLSIGCIPIVLDPIAFSFTDIEGKPILVLKRESYHG